MRLLYTSCSVWKGRVFAEIYPLDRKSHTFMCTRLLMRPVAVPMGKRELEWSKPGQVWSQFRVCMREAAETDWQCHNQQDMFHCSPPSPRAALMPALPPLWGSDAEDWRPWPELRLRQPLPPGRSWWQMWRIWGSHGTFCVAAVEIIWAPMPSNRSLSLWHTAALLIYRNRQGERNC